MNILIYRLCRISTTSVKKGAAITEVVFITAEVAVGQSYRTVLMSCFGPYATSQTAPPPRKHA